MSGIRDLHPHKESRRKKNQINPYECEIWGEKPNRYVKTERNVEVEKETKERSDTVLSVMGLTRKLALW